MEINVKVKILKNKVKISSSATGDKCEIENFSVNSSKILNSNIRNQSKNRSIQEFDIPAGENNHECENNVKFKNLKSKRQFKILSLNVCGLVSKIKMPDFIEYISSYDILCFTETKFDIYMMVMFRLMVLNNCHQ